MSLKETVGEILQRDDFGDLTVTEIANSLAEELKANPNTIRRHLYRLRYHKKNQVQEASHAEDPYEFEETDFEETMPANEEPFEFDEETRVYRFSLPGQEEDLYAYAEEVSSWIKWYTEAGSGLSLREVCKKIWNKDRRSLSEKTLKRVFSLLRVTKASPPLAPHSFQEKEPEELVEDWRLIAEAQVQSKYEATEARHWRSLYEKEKKHGYRLNRVVEEAFNSLPDVDPIEFDFVRESSEESEVEPCVPILLLSDWHVGMKDLGFNSGVLRERIMLLFGEITDWVNVYRRPFDKFQIAIGGDILDGAVELRAGHSFQQDLHGAKQIAFAAETLASLIRKIAELVQVPVTVHTVTGNHGRASKNYREDPSRLCESICYMFADKMTPGVEWNIHQEIVASWKVYDTTCFLTHGDLTPKDLNSLVLSHSCMPPALVLSGHRHELNCSQKNGVFLVSGGSLCGTTSFSRDRLGLSSAPSQILVEVRRDNGPRPVHYMPV